MTSPANICRPTSAGSLPGALALRGTDVSYAVPAIRRIDDMDDEPGIDNDHR